MTRSIHLIAAASLVALSAAIAHALPVVVTDFAVDPSGAQFTIQPVAVADPGSENLAGLPTLAFGVTSQPDGTLNTMKMTWEQGEFTGDEAQAGWELVFGTDPDIRNQQIILSINPPGGWTNAAGVPIPSPGNPGVGDLFQGIRSVQVRAIDMGGALAGGWGLNTDEALRFGLPVTDLLAASLHSLANNFMQTVTINVGPGPVVAGSATITGGPAGALTGPNFLIAGNNNFANIAKLQFFENGILQGGVGVIPGQTGPGLLNYWDHVTVTPEPATLGLLVVSGLAMMLRRRRA